ncbi:hypothetical protein OHB26_35235 [Nocardia sp. NBC_01503]|uniref:3-hydroxyacyl-ACP dehydratase FabZ family protein n=1 Tax=Nocardia sp. NBC_01503 TaxID=2975997 RepID=UPI002E7ABCEE|nr:hypothetical protein [Nocardia sp. NBC_01503]WTL32093.1 hypothetical protein OHB26_35235 [Nocardia sp. NBC_01503]
MRFHLIDRIESWEPLQHITARKMTSVYEDIWQPGAAGPVLPFGLALEALCQAGAWLVLLSSAHTRRAALLTVDEVTVYRDAVPGDVLRMTAQVVHATPEAAVVDGWIEVDGERIMYARNIMCALIEADLLDDPVDTERMARQLLGEELV